MADSNLQTEIKDFAKKLADYYNAVAANMANPALVIPQFEDVLEDLTYDEMYTSALNTAFDMGSLEIGTVTANLHFASGILREANLLSSGKVNYFQELINDVSGVADDLVADSFKDCSVIAGGSPGRGNTI